MSQQQSFGGTSIPGDANIEFIAGSNGTPVPPNPATHILNLKSGLVSNDIAINEHPSTYTLDLVDLVKYTKYVVDNTSFVSVLNFSGNFVASNSIVATVDSVALAAVVFSVNNATTIQNLATRIATATGVLSAVVTGTNQITVQFTGGVHTVNSVVTTAGASQPTATINQSVNAPYYTIQSAINDAHTAGGGIVAIRWSATNYVEDLTLYPNVDLVGIGNTGLNQNVVVQGKATASGVGQTTIAGLRLQTSGDFSLVVSGTNATNLYLSNCYLSSTDHTGISITSTGANAGIILDNCQGDAAGGAHFAITHGGLEYFNCTMTSGSANTLSNASSLFMSNSFFGASLTTSDTATIEINCSKIEGTVTCGGTSGNDYIASSAIAAGVSIAVTIGAGATLALINSMVETTQASAITGAGTLNYSGITFYNGASTITTSTQIPNVSSNDALAIVSPGSYPYTTLGQDALILVDTTSARTIIPMASPATGQRHIIKDDVGSAGTNNITITPSGNTIDGQVSALINTNYGNIEIVFNGTEWSILSESQASSTISFIDQSSGITLLSNTGYYVTASTTQTLPAVPAQGDVVIVACDTAGAVTVAANAGQTIRIGNLSSATSLVSTDIGDTLTLRYRLADTTWITVSSMGNWTVT